MDDEGESSKQICRAKKEKVVSTGWDGKKVWLIANKGGSTWSVESKLERKSLNA